MQTSLVGVVRLSRETEESTSPVRQRSIITSAAEARGATIVGWAEDLGVSASVDPWDRPELGAWLQGDNGPFDGFIAWRVDRLARRVLHFARLLEWAKDEDKQIISATEGFDLSTPLGRMFAQMIAMLAEGELEAIKERTKGSYDYLVSVGRHRGGFLPYGYRAVPNPTGKGFVLEIDPESSAQLERIVKLVVDGRSINSVVTELNAGKVPSSLALQRIRAGKAPEDPKTGKLPKWTVANLAKMLRSESLMGYLVPDKRSDRKYPLDDTGVRVRRAAPILTRTQFDQLQAEIDRREGVTGPRERKGAAMLIRVAHCGHETPDGPCGLRMYVATGRSGKYYRCSSKAIGGTSCGGGSVRAEVLESMMADALLSKVGDLPVYERVFIPGMDHAGEVRETEEALTRLTERLEKVPDGPATDAVLARMAEHTEHLEHLRALPQRDAGWKLEPTGQTYAEVWSGLDGDGRGKLLRDSAVTIMVKGTKPLNVEINLGELEALEPLVRKSVATLPARRGQRARRK